MKTEVRRKAVYRCHEKIKSIEPTWLTHSWLVLVMVWPHSLAVTCIVTAMLAAALLIFDFVCWGFGWLYPDMRAGSWDLELQQASLSQIIHVTASECGQTQTKTNSEWVNHVGSMLLIFSWQWCRCKCFSPRIFAIGSTSYKLLPRPR